MSARTAGDIEAIVLADIMAAVDAIGTQGFLKACMAAAKSAEV